MRQFQSKNLLEALVECKRLMDEYLFYSSNFQMQYSNWVNLRIFLLEKDIIRSRHTTYVWVREAPNEELVTEFLAYLQQLKIKKPNKITEETSLNEIYADYLILQKELQKIKAENREMFKDLKLNYQAKVKAEQKYKDLFSRVNSVLYDPEKDSPLFESFKSAVIKYYGKK
jgi:hypothetical protein